MKSLQIRKLAIATAAASACVLSSGAVLANTLTFQGVTFDMSLVDPNSISLSITGALDNATGDWANITQLAAFEIKTVGAIGAGVSDGPGTWSYSNDSLSANGCASGSSTGGCFTAASPVALTNATMSWQVDFAGDVNLDAPHLKVLFLNADGIKTGSLLSQTVPVPEPETYAMMLAGLGVVGFMARRRRQS